MFHCFHFIFTMTTLTTTLLCTDVLQRSAPIALQPFSVSLLFLSNLLPHLLTAAIVSSESDHIWNANRLVSKASSNIHLFALRVLQFQPCFEGFSAPR